MIEQLIIISTIIYLLMTSINDIKHRFVHDYTSYSFGLLFFVLRILLWIETGDIFQFINIFIYVIPVLIISIILYKIGWWGGGDSKLITALAIGIPFLSTDNLFFLNFSINTLIGGLLFGLIYSFVLALKKYKKVSKVLTKLDLTIILVLSLISVVMFFNNVLYKLFSLLLFTLPLTYLIRKVEPVIQIIDKKVKNLEPGDWIVEDIKIGRKKVLKKPTGLSKEDIQMLQKTKLKYIKIKDGLPFVPSFLIGFFMTLLYGNVLLTIMKHLLVTSMVM